MDVLDEDGRLFGRVNVIDAIVVVAAVSLLVGGVFVVVTDTDGEPTSEPEPGPERYATVAYQVPLESPMAAVSDDATIRAGGDSFAVTDVARSTTTAGRARVVAGFTYEGNLTVGGDRILAGDELTVATDAGRVDAAVLSVDRETGTIDTTSRSLVLRANESQYGARAVEPGVEVVVAGETVATVDAAESGPGGEALVGVTVTARQTTAGHRFGGRQVLVGNRLGLVTGDAIVRGHIVALGTSDPGAAG